jgi:hypothetical protein
VAVEHGPRPDRDALGAVLASQTMNKIDGSRDGQRDLQRAEPPLDGGVRDAFRGVRVRQPNDEDGPGLIDRPQRPQLVEHVLLLIEMGD